MNFVKIKILKILLYKTELYGDVISAENLFKRLEDNLDKITFAGREKAPNGELMKPGYFKPYIFKTIRR